VFAFFKHEERPESALNAVTVARLNGIEAKPFVMPEKKGRGTGTKARATHKTDGTDKSAS
jgi:hypothetical protein